MSAAFVLARTGLRRRRAPLIGLSVVLALGIGVALASLEAATRTQDAYPSYLRRAEVGELVVNPSLNTARAAAIIASAPGVRRVASDALLTATADRGEPRTQAEIDGDGTQVRLSTDGRYTGQDRPVVHQGRMVRSGAEAFVNVEMAESLGLGVGDTLPLAFWGNSYTDPDRQAQSGVMQPLGRANPRVVGIGVFADEVLLDGLYPRHRVVVTPEVGGRFDCTLAVPGAEDTRPIEQLTESILPRGCATSYRYFSIRVHGGDAGVRAVAEALGGRFIDENERLPAALRANNIGYDVIPTVTAAERQRVQRSLDPAVTALRLFGVAAGASTLVVALLGAVRIARREEHDAHIWRALGATRALRMAAMAAPLAVAAMAGLGGALVVGWLASGAGPVASARAVTPTGRLGLSIDVILIAIGGSAVVLAVGIALVAGVLSGTRSPTAPVATSRPWRVLARTPRMSLALGVRAAVDGAGGRGLVAGCAVAVSAVLATVVFSASLGSLVSEAKSFGWPYDVAATINYGYGETTDRAAIAATLDRPEVLRWGSGQRLGWSHHRG